MHGSEATVIPEWMDGWMNGWGPEGEKEWMLPAFLPKRTQLWPCIIYLLTQVTNITTGFQVHTLFIQTSHSLVDLGRTETSHICLGKGFCWPLSAVFLSCGAPHPYSCPDLEQMTYTTLLLGLCLSQTSHSHICSFAAHHKSLRSPEFLSHWTWRQRNNDKLKFKVLQGLQKALHIQQDSNPGLLPPSPQPFPSPHCLP